MAFDNDTGDTPEPAAAQPAAVGESAAPAAAPEPAASTPEDTGEPKTALEAALKALEKSAPGDAAAAKPAETVESTEPQPTAAEDAQDESLDDVPMLPAEVFSALPQEARSTFNALRKQVKTYREDAVRGRAVTEYLQTAGLAPEEFAELQSVGALMKRDPTKAREVLLEHVARIEEYLGLRLPDDIHQDVEQGFISEDRARELSQARAKARAAETAVAEREAMEATRQKVGAVEAWEAATRETDPDFDAKLPNVRQAVELEILRRERAGQPVATPKDALDVVKAAYESTNAMLKRFAPRTARVPASPSSAAPVPAAPPAEPKTALEAAWAALRKSA